MRASRMRDASVRGAEPLCAEAGGPPLGRAGQSGFGIALTRRQLLGAAGVALLGRLAWPRLARAAEPYALPQAARDALASSRLAYVSPLLENGEESRCHGEVWFFVDAGALVIATAADRWKARAIRSGRDRARLWIGDFGPVGRAGKRYRQAPSFLARAEISRDEALFERLMQAYGRRYADEWGKWKPRFARGHADGSRVVVRYTPIGA